MNDFKGSALKKDEEKCLKICFDKLKYIEQMYLSQLKDVMEYCVIHDPALKKQFKEKNK